MNPQPPKRALRFLRWFCREDCLEEFEGDLIELFEKYHEESPRKARRKFFWGVLRCFRPGFMKVFKKINHSKRIFMFKHHFKVAGRNILSNRGYSFINILGLTLGIACSLIIYLWTERELDIDHQHADSDLIYSVYTREVFGGGMNASYNTPAHLPEALKEYVPEIVNATGFAKSFRLSLPGATEESFVVGDEVQKWKGSRGSPDFFKVFDFKLLAGSAETVLMDPLNIAISRKMAVAFFGSPEMAMGQTIRYQNQDDLQVTAVFEDIGVESSLKFDYLTHWKKWVDSDRIKQAWAHFGTQTYIKVKEGTNITDLEEKIKDLLGLALEFSEDYRVEMGLQKFEDQYLYGNFENGFPSAGRKIYVDTFRGIAVFILLIAVVNFVNLTSATVIKRAKEVGIRKVIGANSSLLRSQFVTESLLLVSVAMAISLLLVGSVFLIFDGSVFYALSLPVNNVEFWITIVVFTLCLGLFSGVYPAIVLSRIKLIPALRNLAVTGKGSGIFRKSLVVFQYSVSLLLILATLVITWQTNFVQNKELGFDRDKLISLPLEGELLTNYNLFRVEASKMPGIASVDRSSQTPYNMGFSTSYVDWEDKDDNEPATFTPSSVGFDFIPTMDLEIVKGRDFSRERPVDANNFIINEMAEKIFGPGDALGKKVSVFGKEGHIIGVVKDYHYSSLHTPIKPLILDVKEDLNFGTVVVRIEEGREDLALQSLRQVWEKLNPGYAFSYAFVSDAYENLYESEVKVSSLIQSFSVLAIFISCLGLFGLVTFTTEQRIKEIGVRKILGASIMNLFHLMSRQFVYLLAIAMVFAMPLGYYFIENWLQGFAYRIGLEWWLFALACLLVIGISYLVMGGRVIKIVSMNPVNTLRRE